MWLGQNSTPELMTVVEQVNKVISVKKTVYQFLEF